MKYYLLVILAISPAIALAQAEAVRTFNAIPFLNGIVNTANLADALFNIAIAIAAILVVVRLIWAGSQYMLTGLVTRKESAKQEIRDALIGLLIILGSVTLLQTINPQLLNLNALGELESATTTALTATGIEGAYIDGPIEVGDSLTFGEMADFCREHASRDELCTSRIVVDFAEKCNESGGESVWVPRGGVSSYHLCQARN